MSCAARNLHEIQTRPRRLSAPGECRTPTQKQTTLFMASGARLEPVIARNAMPHTSAKGQPPELHPTRGRRVLTAPDSATGNDTAGR